MSGISIEKIKQGISGITESFGCYMEESCVVCLASQKHSQSVDMEVGSNEFGTKLFTLLWDMIVTPDIMRSHNDEKRATDFGAMCVSILLTLHLTDFDAFTTSATNNGFDFWMEKEGDTFGMRTRLEVSGIRKATSSNSIKSRLGEKQQRLLKYPDQNNPVYICVVEFSKPEAAFFSNNF